MVSKINSYDLAASSLEESVCYSITDQQLFYITSNNVNKTDRTMTLQKRNLITGKSERYNLKMHGEMEIEQVPYSFAVSAKHLVLNDDHEGSIIQYNRMKNGFAPDKKIVIGKNLRFRSVSFLKDELFLFYEVYAGADSTIPPVSLAVYDASTGLTINLIHPELHCMAYSYFPVSPVSFNSGLIALSDLCEYKIHFFDYALNAVKTISYTDLNSNFLKDDFPFETDPLKVHPKLTIHKLLEIDKTIDRIAGIHFLNDSSLMVLFNEKEKGTCKVDFWNLNDTSKPIARLKDVALSFIKNKYIETDHLPLLIKSSSPPFIRNNVLYVISGDFYLPEKSMTYDDYINSKNMFYEKNDPVYHLQQFYLDVR